VENEEKKYSNNLISELNRLVSAGKSGNFNISLNYQGLSDEEELVLGLVSQAISCYEATIEHDLKNSKLTDDSLLEKERAMLMLDSSPLCIQIWDRNLNTIDCNEAGVKLYGFKDKKEYAERFIAECSPEYQPDGRRSDVKAVALVNKAFKEGYCRFDWMHRLPEDGTLFPADITLVRAKYGDENVVLGYTRDLREHHKMMEEVKQRDSLLRAVNKSAVLLLTTDENEDIEASILASMELVGRSVEADRVHIWRNEMINGEQKFFHAYEWLSEIGQKKVVVRKGTMTPYSKMSDWISRFERDEYIGGPLTGMLESEQEYFKDFDIMSVFIIPLFLDDHLWGLVSIDDCERERDLTNDEISILRSVSLMMASAINRHALVIKRTQDLAMQTAMFAALFDSIPDHVFVKDLNLHYMQCNKSLLEFHGLSSDDIVGKTDTEAFAVSKELADGFDFWDNRVISEKETYTIENSIPGKNGRIRYSETIKTPLLHNDSVIGVLGISRDITERKETEQKTAAHYEYARKLTDTLAEIAKSPSISAGDLNGTVRNIVRQGCIALGAHRVSAWELDDDTNALVNVSSYQMPTDRFGTLPDFDLSKQKRYYELLKTERLVVANDAWELPYAVNKANANIGLCAMLDAPIKVEGKLVGVICIEQMTCDEYPGMRRWTPEEQGFVSSMADLFALAVAGFERRVALDEAKSANKAKSGFLARMSHEIRTPMNSILGITEILVQNERLPVEVREGLDRIYTSCDLLLSIINEILDFSKIEAGKMEILPASYSTASMLNDSIQLNVVRLGEKPVEFVVDINENTPASLVGDELRIKQILNNLLSNAIKYTNSGKITLSVTTEPIAECDSVSLIISVQDTGFGMTKEQVDTIFDEYSRIDQSPGSYIEGTGLGLAITQRLITLMDGEIHVQSKPAAGSLFTVRLPQKIHGSGVLGNEVVKKLNSFNYTTNKGRDRRKGVRDIMPYGSVLIVDDVETNRFVAAGLMKLFKLQVETVDSGLKAIDIIKSGKTYDVIFMDYMMPEMDGIETVGQLRTLGYSEPIVALTANVVAGQAEIFIQNGFDDIIGKPIDIRRLTYILNRYVRDKQPAEIIEAVRQQQISDARAERDSDNEASRETDANNNVVKKLLSTELTGLDIKQGLEQYNGDVKTYMGILNSYVNSIKSLLSEIESVSQENLPFYKIRVHGIKGASYDIYAKTTGNAAERLENAAETGDIEYVCKHNQRFVEETRKFVASMADMLSSIVLEDQTGKKDKPDNELLSRLILACEVYDMEGINAIMSEIDEFEYTSDDGLTGWLREKVGSMSFGEITERLTAM
jgi:PAS domain S-box-containing protein